MKNRLFPLLAVLICGCGVHENYEDYGLKSSADLTLKASNHPHGFGQTQCFTCHVQTNIHRVDHLGSPLFSSAAPLVAGGGIAVCSGCHGKNGVSQ